MKPTAIWNIFGLIYYLDFNLNLVFWSSSWWFSFSIPRHNYNTYVLPFLWRYIIFIMLSLSEKGRLNIMNVERVVSSIAWNTKVYNWSNSRQDHSQQAQREKCLINFTWQALLYKNDSISRQYQPRFSGGDRRREDHHQVLSLSRDTRRRWSQQHLWCWGCWPTC